MFDKKFENQAEYILKDQSQTESLLKRTMRKLSNLPLIGDAFADIPTLVDMVRDYSNGTYREIPLSSIIMITAALIYFISPVNVIPDYIPLIGKIDDVAVIVLTARTLRRDVDDYKEWKKSFQNGNV